MLKYGNPIENSQTWNGDHLEVVQAIVEKDFKDVLTFANGKQYDLIEMLTPNLEEYEKVCTLLRKLLKNPNLHNEIIETMPYDIKTKYMAELEKKAKEEKMKADKIAKELAEKEAKEKAEKEAKEKKEKEEADERAKIEAEAKAKAAEAEAKAKEESDAKEKADAPNPAEEAKPAEEAPK